jgi:hypothetical protein
MFRILEGDAMGYLLFAFQTKYYSKAESLKYISLTQRLRRQPLAKASGEGLSARGTRKGSKHYTRIVASAI